MKKTLSIILFVLLFIPATMFAQDYSDYGKDDSYGYQDSQESEVRVYIPLDDGEGSMLTDKGDYCPGIGDGIAIDLDNDKIIPAPGAYEETTGEATTEGW